MPALLHHRRKAGSAVRVAEKSYMMAIMQTKKAKPASSRKQLTHERIVDVASRVIRRSGYDGTGVADIMKEAGLTHGGFYAHFDSRDALLAEAGDRAGAEAVAIATRVAASAPPGQGLQAIMQAYLSPEHIATIETGCPVSALGSEMPRQAPEVRHAATLHIKEMIDVLARQMPDWGQPQAHERALAMMCALIGTTMLARAVDDPKLSEALCAATLKQFSPGAA
jgi:AcrR family transcriptional regulator